MGHSGALCAGRTTAFSGCCCDNADSNRDAELNCSGVDSGLFEADMLKTSLGWVATTCNAIVSPLLTVVGSSI